MALWRPQVRASSLLEELAHSFIFCPCRSVISDNFHGFSNQQWLAESAAHGSDLFYLQNGDGLYLSYEGKPEKQKGLICSRTKQAWRIIIDDRDPLTRNILHPTESHLNVEVKRGSSELHTEIWLYQAAQHAQAWEFVAVDARSVLPVLIGHTAVIGYPEHGGNNQRWTVEKAGNDTVYLKNNDGGKYLSFEGRIHAKQRLVCTDNKQAFKIILDPANNNFCMILSPDRPQLNAEVEKGLKTPGQQIWWYFARERAQSWAFIDVTDFAVKPGTSYFIQNIPSGNVLDFNLTDRKRVLSWPKNGGKNQQWTVQFAGQNTYHLRNGEGGYLSYEGSAENQKTFVCSPQPRPFYIFVDPDNAEEGVLRTFMIVDASRPRLNIEVKGGSAATGETVWLYEAAQRPQPWGFFPV
ncbi:hypothetical protein DL93DRAFT_2101539 [Clavulina sp. PMI_390]|nr:hypothetical protein DL93DRAFT_2101539 [Clavulina sp. PMI_390]